MVPQGEKIYGAEDRDMEESEELLHVSRRRYVVEFPPFLLEPTTVHNVRILKKVYYLVSF